MDNKKTGELGNQITESAVHSLMWNIGIMVLADLAGRQKNPDEFMDTFLNNWEDLEKARLTTYMEKLFPDRKMRELMKEDFEKERNKVLSELSIFVRRNFEKVKERQGDKNERKR